MNDPTGIPDGPLAAAAAPPEEDVPMSVTMTFLPTGEIRLSDPFLAEPEDDVLPTEEGSPAPGGGTQTFPTLDDAVRHLVQVAMAVGPSRTESAGMDEGFDEDARHTGGPAHGAKNY